MAQYFNLTLDTTAPSSGILSGLSSYYNSNATVTISADGASFMKVWTNQTAVGTLSDTQVPSSWEPYNTSKTVSFTGQGTQYVHAVFMDEVGNIGSVVNSSATVYDTVAPTVTSVSINSGDGYTRITSNTVRVSFSDATSGVASVTLSGNDIASTERKSYTVTDAERTAGYKDITITLQGADGTKTVTATVTDNAGNTSTSSLDTIVLDTSAAVITATLRDSEDEANLPGYVNYRDYGVRIVTEATDITHYKIWEGNTEPSSWTAISNATEVSGVGYFVDNLELSTGDGTKTIHVKVQDIAGNITENAALSVILDTTAPVVTLSANKSVIGPNSGYDTVTLTINATDTNSVQGLNYILSTSRTNLEDFIFDPSEDNEIDTSRILSSGSLSNGSKTLSITFDDIDEAGGSDIQEIACMVTDIAGNAGLDSNYLMISLDEEAPTGSITANSYYNTNTVTVTLSGSDGGGAVLSDMKVYLDSNTASYENYAAGTYTFTNVAEGAHTVHVQFRDSVGNESEVYDSEQFIVDTTAPTGSISTSQYTNSRTITVNISASDAKNSLAVSGVSKMKVWEDGQTVPSSWENYAATKSITLAEGNDGLRTIKALFKDNAGNEMTTPVTCTTTLDLDEPDAVLNLLKTDSNGLPARVNYRNFKAKISHTAPDTSPIVQYKLSGDFDQSSSEWQVFTYDSGQTYMTISNLTLTTGDGLKTITLQLKDAAGNVSSAVDATVIYDTAPPVIDVNAPDYNVVSKEHTLRLNASGTAITGKYNDMCIFTWSANENLAAFKVCVNTAGQTAATAEAIGTEHGSLNMSGSAVTANTDVTSTIFGADFAATEVVNDTDGAYEIIVYGQDEGGTWSAVHVLS